MSSRVALNQVKYKVRYNVVLLKEFTVNDLVNSTGLNPESIRTELQRMKKEGLIITKGRIKASKKRGGSPMVYSLSENPVIRLELSKSVDKFMELPTSKQYKDSHYLHAKRKLDQVSIGQQFLSPMLMGEINNELSISELFLSGGLAKESNRAYIIFERGRLAYMTSNFEDAEKFFLLSKKLLVDIEDEFTKDQIQCFLVSINACKQYRPYPPSNYDDMDWARILCSVVDENREILSNPLVKLMMDLLQRVATSTNEKLCSDAFKLFREATSRPEALETLAQEIRSNLSSGIQIPTMSIDSHMMSRSEKIIEDDLEKILSGVIAKSKKQTR